MNPRVEAAAGALDRSGLPPVQLLAPDGSYHPDPDHPHDLQDGDLLALHRLMVVTRRVDRETINLQRQGEVGVYPSCLGQEGVQVGAASALNDHDWIFPQYRELGMALVRGLHQADLAQLWRGTEGLGYDPYEHRFAPISIPIGTQLLHAVGFAMGARLDGEPLVVLACCGDGATSTGDVHEALTFAGVFRAPVVFLIQNNRYAISVPIERQTAAENLARKAIGYGIPGWRCDGNDVLASYAVVRRAVDRARRGHGPTLIEAMTYRMEAHTTSDDPTRYREDDEVARFADLDPLVRLERFLAARGLLDDETRLRVEDAAATAAAEVRAGVIGAIGEDPMSLFAHVYRDDRGFFEEQRGLLAREIRGLEVANEERR